jgi:hypothetical protein
MVLRRVVAEAPRENTGAIQQDILMVRDWIQARYRDALKRWTWSTLRVPLAPPITTTTGVSIYPLPLNWQMYHDFYNTTIPQQLLPKPLRYLHELDPQRTQTGPPRYFTILSGGTSNFSGTPTPFQVQVYPIPDSAYIIAGNYWCIPQDPVIWSDILLLPDIEFLVRGCIADAYSWLGGRTNNPQMRALAQQYEADYVRLLDRSVEIDRPNVILPDNVKDGIGANVWYSADQIRAFDMRMAPF